MGGRLPRARATQQGAMLLSKEFACRRWASCTPGLQLAGLPELRHGSRAANRRRPQHGVRHLLSGASAASLTDLATAWGSGVSHSLPHLLPPDCLHILASLPGICFKTNPECQNEQDRAFVAAITIPLAVLAAAVAFLLRPLPKDRVESGELFEDSVTGTVFESPEGAQPERDRLGELCFRAIGYTPWPLQEGEEGQRIRIDVGKPGAQQPRTFLFSKILRQPSQLLTVTLPRPLGLVFEEDKRNKRAIVAGLVPGGNAEQLQRRFRLDPSLAARAPKEGDVLRACTCTNIVYKTGALFFGAQRPERHIVVYGADGQRWPAVMEALQKGLVADGEVTLVLERQVPPPEQQQRVQ